ncbi:MAG: hypothetical protein MJE66_18135 [Proteobacteria bacterium]|nr:hypothetical protein [Pseudomonadota bacterium]
MSGRRIPKLCGAAVALVALACGGDGSGGSPPTFRSSSNTPGCVALPGRFPPGFAFVPGTDRVVVGNLNPDGLIPLDAESQPFDVPPGANQLTLPADTDGDGVPELFLRPILDDVTAVAADLLLATASSYESVLFLDPGVFPRELELALDASFGPDDFVNFPDPGSSEIRTGMTTFACLRPGAGARDSRGRALTEVLSPSQYCDPATPSFRANFTSGAVVHGGRLFVSMSNLDASTAGEVDTVYLPGAVLVFDIDLGADPPRLEPNRDAPVIFTSAFNATHVQAYTTPGGRPLVLVTQTGAIGIAPDDPGTPEIEGGAVGLTDGAVDVIDAGAGVPALLASYALRDANPAGRGLAVDPTGRLAIGGDVTSRRLAAVDLAPLDALGAAGPTPVVFDAGSGVVFDGQNPFVIPRRPDGAPAVTCAGFVESVAINQAGDRAFVLEACDGTLTTLDVDLTGPPATWLRVAGQQGVAAPIRSDTFGLDRQPAALAVRPGVPGVDYAGPDIFFTVGEPVGLFCGLRVDSP